jgi:hypothetical protein
VFITSRLIIKLITRPRGLHSGNKYHTIGLEEVFIF